MRDEANRQMYELARQSQAAGYGGGGAVGGGGMATGAILGASAGTLGYPHRRPMVPMPGLMHGFPPVSEPIPTTPTELVAGLEGHPVHGPQFRAFMGELAKAIALRDETINTMAGKLEDAKDDYESQSKAMDAREKEFSTCLEDVLGAFDSDIMAPMSRDEVWSPDDFEKSVRIIRKHYRV